VIAQMLGISVDLTLPADAVAQTFAILAKRGVGKTYTALALVEELLGGRSPGHHRRFRRRLLGVVGGRNVAGPSPAATAW
jgi:hypothetical protein